MVKREKVLLSVLGGALVLAGAYAWRTLRATPAGGPAGSAARPRSQGGGESVRRIDLDRLERPTTAGKVGGRDLFAFGAPPPPPAPPPTLEPPPPPVVQPVALVPAAPPLMPLNLKYIGSLDAPQGVKVAFFMNDQKEVLMGQVGETVMNRFKVMKIGLESADVQMLGSETLQRVPLRSN
ncbi:MAG TPA: hypothetical protein VJU18_11550 [Vicinamibacteria bacterium]|nr:hypothetical protein [Vicinamibacteria bacterium]